VGSSGDFHARTKLTFHPLNVFGVIVALSLRMCVFEAFPFRPAHAFDRAVNLSTYGYKQVGATFSRAGPRVSPSGHERIDGSCQELVLAVAFVPFHNPMAPNAHREFRQRWESPRIARLEGTQTVTQAALDRPKCTYWETENPVLVLGAQRLNSLFVFCVVWVDRRADEEQLCVIWKLRRKVLGRESVIEPFAGRECIEIDAGEL
jgi:hypothetical protein